MHSQEQQQPKQTSGGGGQRARDRFSRTLFLRQLFEQKHQPKASDERECLRQSSVPSLVSTSSSSSSNPNPIFDSATMNSKSTISNTPQRRTHGDISRGLSRISSDPALSSSSLSSRPRPSPIFNSVSTSSMTSQASAKTDIVSPTIRREDIRQRQKGPNRFSSTKREDIRMGQKGPNRFAFFWTIGCQNVSFLNEWVISKHYIRW